MLLLYSQAVKNLVNSCSAQRLATTLLVGLVIIGALICLPACTARNGAGEAEETVATPFYNWDGFVKSGQFYGYTQDNKAALKTGIDISESQGWVDWQAVKESGIAFAFIRIGYRGSTEGGIYKDDYFDYNISEAQNAGLECGVYFFSQAISEEEAREEAEFVLECLGNTKLEYPVVFDFEMRASGINSRVSGIDKQTATLIASTFCETIEAAGYESMLYGNAFDLGHYNDELLDRWPLWFAEYGALPSFTKEFAIWQYASDGSIKGIDTAVDLNLDLHDVLAETQ